jgi:hypothetical protein
MNEMVKRVALAIATSDDIARLAIKAMREPTPDMKRAAYEMFNDEHPVPIWEIMIDEAMK